MVINFSNVDYESQPTMVLRTLSGKALQTLGYAFNIEAEFCYNETSQLTFDYPAHVDGKDVPGYDLLTGMTVIDLIGYGQFIMVDPEVKRQGGYEIKSCKCYSLEYEMTFKKITLPEDTYNFYGGLIGVDNNSVLDIILEYAPEWRIGSVSSTLYNKYRTFEVKDQNVYNFMKSELQETYHCVFEFDTYNRIINVRDTNDNVPTQQIYLSEENLIKEVEVNEDTENIFTTLDVNGADGVDIRSVNPTGLNKIYNLDYFMTITNFEQSLIDKWYNWDNKVKAAQQEYYNLTMQAVLNTQALAAERAKLTTIEGQLKAQEAVQATLIEQFASDPNDKVAEAELPGAAAAVEELNRKIAEQKAVIADLEVVRTQNQNNLSDYNESLKITNNFTADEYRLLSRYFKEDAVSDSSFVVSDYNNYDGKSYTAELPANYIQIKGARITKVKDKDLYMIEGGVLDVTFGTSNSHRILASIIRATAEQHRDSSGETRLTISALTKGCSGYDPATKETYVFAKGCITLCGKNASSWASDCTPETGDTPQSLEYGTYLTTTYWDTCDAYVTSDASEYEKYAVEKELLEYGEDALKKLAYPSYSFSVDAANFLALEDFKIFAQNLELGKRVYLENTMGFVGKDKRVITVLTPIVLKVNLSFGDPSSMKIEFSDKYSLSDSSFNLVDLIEKSVSMGKSLDLSKYNYGAYKDSGAADTIHNFITSALDVSKNAILSSSGQAISWDENGLRLRKHKPAVGAELNAEENQYEPEQIWMINNNICFTDDYWQTAKMAIGHFIDPNPNVIGNTGLGNGDCWGIVAPNIVGTLLAGENLAINSEDASFTVDKNGARLHNASFEITNESNGSQIVLDPDLGFGIGVRVSDYDNIYFTNGNTKQKEWDEAKCRLYINPQGDLVFKGTLDGANGVFRGSLKIGDVAWYPGNVEDLKFFVDNQGNMYISGKRHPSGAITDSKFSVTKDGILTAVDGNFKGVVDADDLRIKGTSILKYVTNSQGDRQQVISNQFVDLGNIQIDGTKGDITLTGNSKQNGIKIIGQSGDIELRGANNFINLSGSSGTIVMGNSRGTNITIDAWGNIHLNGNVIWGSGSGGGGGSDSSTEITFDDILKALGNEPANGIYNYNGHIGINATAIRTGAIDAALITTGTLNAERIRLSTEDPSISYEVNDNIKGGIQHIIGSTGQSATNGIQMWARNRTSWGEGQVAATDGGARITFIPPFANNSEVSAHASGVTLTGNAISSSVAIQTNSDITKKKDISIDIDKYEQVFDKLAPASFKYIDGNSGRTHIGFIAQDVERAIKNSGLTNKDFAALCISSTDNNYTNGQYSLRYEEFIALNTHMIQKANKRIQELETELRNIKEKLHNGTD